MNEAEPRSQPAIFEQHEIRRVYDEATETWWFSVVDIIQVLTQQADYQTARKYWNKLKERLGKEGSQLVTDCHQLKMAAAAHHQEGLERAMNEAETRAEHVKVGVEELDRGKLSPLLKLKYHNAISDAWADLGRPEEVGFIFAGFQKYLYQPGA